MTHNRIAGVDHMEIKRLVAGFYDTSTFVGYFIPNPFLYK